MVLFNILLVFSIIMHIERFHQNLTALEDLADFVEPVFCMCLIELKTTLKPTDCTTPVPSRHKLAGEVDRRLYL